MAEDFDSVITAKKEAEKKFKSSVDRLNNILSRITKILIEIKSNAPEILNDRRLYSRDLMDLIEEMPAADIDNVGELINFIRKVEQKVDKLNKRCKVLNSDIKKILDIKHEIENLKNKKDVLMEEISNIKKRIIKNYPFKMEDVISVTPIQPLLDSIKDIEIYLGSDSSRSTYCIMEISVRILELIKEKIQELEKKLSDTASDDDIRRLLDRYKSFRKKYIGIKNINLQFLINVIGKIILLGMIYRTLGRYNESSEILKIASVMLENAAKSRSFSRANL